MATWFLLSGASTGGGGGTEREIKTNCYPLYVDIERKDGCSLGRVRGLGRFLRGSDVEG